MAAKAEFKDCVDKCMKLVFGFANSFVLKAVLDLGIPDILGKAGGELQLDEIAAQLPSKTVELDYLDRIMTFAALNGIFTEKSSAEGVVITQLGQKRFCLTPLSSILLQTEGEHSFVNLSQMLLSKPNVESFMTFSEAVLSGTNPFKLAHGEQIWDYGKTHPEWDRIFNSAMTCNASYFVITVIKDYRGFEGVKRLVDVGGGHGAVLTGITKAYPGIEAVNFDLPHVIAEAPEIPGVTHVSGDMFEKVPEGDAILMKGVLHDWSDGESISVLKNCHRALPEEVGKVIIVEQVLAEPKVAEQVVMDMVMLAMTATGRERTALQWHHLLTAGGFHRVHITPTSGGAKVIEGYKC